MKLPLIFLLVTATIQVANANLQLSVTADDRRVIDLGTFGYNAGGVFSLKVTHFFLDDPAMFVEGGHVNHNESIGFVLQQVPSALAARIEPHYEMNPDGTRPCFIDMKMDKDKRFIIPLNGEHMVTMQNTTYRKTIKEPGLYALFFYNCKGFKVKGQKASSKLDPVAVSFEATAEEYNVNPASGERNYLSVGDQPLPIVYGLFFVIFASMAILWARMMRFNSTYVTGMHKVMLFLVTVKALSLLFEAAKYSHYGTTGQGSVWDVFYYVFLTAKGMTLFAVLILLGSGWSILKPFLSEGDKKLLLVLVPLQVIINILIAIIEESNEGRRNYNNFMDILRLLDVLCCCGVLLPVVWSIKNLRDAAELDEKAALSLSRMRQFRTFYIVVVAYIYFTRIIIVMIDGSLGFQLLYLAKVLREVVAVLFYGYTGHKFRPIKENPYLNLNQEDLDEIRQRNEMKDVEMREVHHQREEVV